jgi:hypothetical protein
MDSSSRSDDRAIEFEPIAGDVDDVIPGRLEPWSLGDETVRTQQVALVHLP